MFLPTFINHDEVFSKKFQLFFSQYVPIVKFVFLTLIIYPRDQIIYCFPPFILIYSASLGLKIEKRRTHITFCKCNLFQEMSNFKSYHLYTSFTLNLVKDRTFFYPYTSEIGNITKTTNIILVKNFREKHI